MQLYKSRLKVNHRNIYQMRLVVIGIISIGMFGCNRCDDSKAIAATESTAPPELIGQLPGYNLSKPDHIARLPKKLKEASDVTAINQNAVAMVQDEKGLIFLYDLQKDDVIRKVKFGPKGDYEGLAEVGDFMYVMESSGILYKIANWQQNTGHKSNAEDSAESQRLNIPTKNNEGLCYDPFGKTLLIAPKSRWKKKDGGGKHKRPVFAVNLESEKMTSEPVFELNTEDILNFAQTHHLTIPGKISKKGKFKEKLQFMPAAVAVHPKTGEIYISSAEDRVIVSFDRQSHLTGFSMLDPKLFLQPEGLTFLPDGTLVVVNESPKKKPGILLFNWHPNGGASMSKP